MCGDLSILGRKKAATEQNSQRTKFKINLTWEENLLLMLTVCFHMTLERLP